MSNKSDTEVSIKAAYENAASLLESGEIDLAEYQLSEILKKFPDEPNALRLSGLSSLQKGKPEIALIPLKKALKVAPDFYQVYENLSQAWVLLGNLEEAEICLKKYLENLYPDLKKHFLQDVLRFAVNQEYVSENLNLKPIDEIAIFPPVSGG